MTNLRPLLDAIGKVEAGKRGYNAMYLPAERALGPKTLTTMRVREVQALQQQMVKVSASSACGRYQFIRATLAGLLAEAGVSPEQRFDEALQDDLATRLLHRRGLGRYLAGTLSREDFANNLAKEWASLPVVTPINGKKVGQSYYAGDGLNHAYMTPETILGHLDRLKTVPAPPDVDPAPEPDEAPAKPKMTPWQAFWTSVTVAATGAAAWLAENVEIVLGGLAATALVAAFVIWRKRK